MRPLADPFRDKFGGLPCGGIGIQRLRFFVANDAALFTATMGGFRNLPVVGCDRKNGLVEARGGRCVVRVAEALKLGLLAGALCHADLFIGDVFEMEIAAS